MEKLSAAVAGCCLHFKRHRLLQQGLLVLLLSVILLQNQPRPQQQRLLLYVKKSFSPDSCREVSLAAEHATAFGATPLASLYIMAAAAASPSPAAAGVQNAVSGGSNDSAPAVVATTTAAATEGQSSSSKSSESAALEAKYSLGNCKYRSLPNSLNDILSYNGEIQIGDVFGLPASSLLHEQRITFSLPQQQLQQPESNSKSLRRQAVLSVSVELHRDSVAEFNHLQLYRRSAGEKPHPLVSAAEAAAAADGAGAMQAALRKQHAIAIGKRVEGTGGPRTRVILSAALTDKSPSTTPDLFDLVFSFRDSLGRFPAMDEASSVHSPLLPCFPVRLDLALVPLERMALHMPARCPAESHLPPESKTPLELGDEALVFSNHAANPFVFVFPAADASWPPFSMPVWQQTLRVPRKLHRFARLFFRLSFRFLSGPLQLLLELFDESSPPDATAKAPQCLLGCLGGTPTFNGQLIDHAMPTGFIYKMWLLAGEPIFSNAAATQCFEFDFEYAVSFEAKLTPFEVGTHAWRCMYARLPHKIQQLDSISSAPVSTETSTGVVKSEDKTAKSFLVENGPDNRAEEVGLIRARIVDLKDHFGFPHDEVDEMLHFVELDIKEPSDLRVTLFKSQVRLRAALLSGNEPSQEEPGKGETEKNLHAKKEQKTNVGGVIKCSEKQLAGQTSSEGDVLRMHCRIGVGVVKLALYAEYPLGGISPCKSFYMHLTLTPTAVLSQRYACSLQQYMPPLLISPQGPPPVSAPPASENPIELGEVKESTTEFFQSFVYKEAAAAVLNSSSAFAAAAKAHFSVKPAVSSQTFLHVALLSDFAAADFTALIRRGKDPEQLNDYVVSFSHDYQHLIGPFEPGDYDVDFVLLSPQVVDAAAAADALCLPFSLDLRLVKRAGDDLHSAAWLCANRMPHLPRIIWGVAGLQTTLDKEFRLPSAGYHSMHIFIPKNSILKIHVQNNSHSTEPRLSIAPQDRPQEKLAEAYSNLFLEADVEGDYVIRLHFPAASGSRIGQPLCPTVRLHVVLLPRASIPRCPWTTGLTTLLDHTTLHAKAKEHMETALDSHIFIPKEIGAHKLEVAAPRNVWLSPSLQQTQFNFQSESPFTSVRVELVMHPPWLPARLLLYKKDGNLLRHNPEAVGHTIQNRLLLLAPDAGAGNFVLMLQLYDSVDISTEQLCAHATIHAEIGDANEMSVNAMRSELLGLPDLMPAEPPPSSFNRRGWLALADTPVIATAIFRVDKMSVSKREEYEKEEKREEDEKDGKDEKHEEKGTQEKDENFGKNEQGKKEENTKKDENLEKVVGEVRPEQDSSIRRRRQGKNKNGKFEKALATVRNRRGQTVAGAAVVGSAWTELKVEKLTLFRMVGEPAALSLDTMLFQLYKGSSDSSAALSAASESPSETQLLLQHPVEQGLAQPKQLGELVEEAENSMLALLQPSTTYYLRYQAAVPFLMTIGISSVEQLQKDLSTVVWNTDSSTPGLKNSDCLPIIPQISLPSPLPHVYESDVFQFRLQANKQAELTSISLQLAAASVLYAEAHSNFLVDFVTVSVRVDEGTWVGEQHGRVNFLRLTLQPGHYQIRLSLGEAANKKVPEQLVKQQISQLEQCLHFFVKLKAVAINYAGPSTAAETGETCFSHGALPLPLNFHSLDGGSAVLGGPMDSEGRLLVRSKIVLSEGDSGAGGRKSVTLDTKGKSVILKVGIFTENRDNSLTFQVRDVHSLPLTPLMEWNILDGGFEKIYELEGNRRPFGSSESASVFYLDFRVEQNDQLSPSPCVLFDLALQTMPLTAKPQMTACSGGPALPLPLLPEKFFSKTEVAAAAHASSSHEQGDLQVVKTPLSLVEEKKEGFLVTIPFSLVEESFILTEVRYNFFVSHIELDLIDNSLQQQTSIDPEPVAAGELDFIGKGEAPLNARQWIATQLAPGNYVLRVADDHYAEHFFDTSAAAAEQQQQAGLVGTSRACFPLQFVFQVFSLVAAAQQQHQQLPSESDSSSVMDKRRPSLPPLILGIHPDPSVPVKFGQDLLILVRLSVAAAALKQQQQHREESASLVGASGLTVKAAEFVNLDAMPNSIEHFQNVSMPIAEDEEEGGGLVWSFLFKSEDLQRLGNSAKFSLDLLTKEATRRQRYRFPAILSSFSSSNNTASNNTSKNTDKDSEASRRSSSTNSNKKGEADEFFTDYVEFAFQSPGALRENVPWSGGNLISLEQQQSQQQQLQGGVEGLLQSREPQQQQEQQLQETEKKQEGLVNVTAGLVHEETFSTKKLQEQQHQSLQQNTTPEKGAAAGGAQPPPPHTPPKVPRSSLIIEEEEEEELLLPQQKEPASATVAAVAKKPPRAMPWDRWEALHQQQQQWQHQQHKHQQEKREENTYKEENEYIPNCGPGFQWNDETGDCEARNDEPPSALIVLFVSAIGIGGLLLLSHYANRRRQKGGFCTPPPDPGFPMSRLNSESGGSEQFNFFHRRSNGSPLSNRRLEFDDDEV